MRIHAVIFSWRNHVEKARSIAAQVAPHVEKLTVVDSSGEPPVDGDDGWVRLDPSHYYGHMFREALGLFDGDVLLQIQADASADDWTTGGGSSPPAANAIASGTSGSGRPRSTTRPGTRRPSRSAR
jgi:hypothetical protein